MIGEISSFSNALANAIVVEPRNVLRQEDCWVDLPPRVLVKAFAKAFEKEEISPIIYFFLSIPYYLIFDSYCLARWQKYLSFA